MGAEPATVEPGDERQPTGENVAVAEPNTEPATVEVVHAPSHLSQAIALVAIVVAVGTTAPFSLLALPFGVAGLAIVAGSSFVTHSRGWLSVGVGVVLLGAVISGGYGAVPLEVMLVGVSAALLALDVGQYGLGVGAHLGRGAPTRRLEVTHAMFTLLALSVASAFVYVVYLFAGSGRPASAVALMVVGAVVLMWAFRR